MITMRLDSKYFNLVSKGEKYVEFRLYDKKRQMIKPGDTIFFKHISENTGVHVKVDAIVVENNFEELFKVHSITVGITGNTQAEILNDLKRLYPEKTERRCAIFFSPLNEEGETCDCDEFWDGCSCGDKQEVD